MSTVDKLSNWVLTIDASQFLIGCNKKAVFLKSQLALIRGAWKCKLVAIITNFISSFSLSVTNTRYSSKRKTSMALLHFQLFGSISLTVLCINRWSSFKGGKSFTWIRISVRHYNQVHCQVHCQLSCSLAGSLSIPRAKQIKIFKRVRNNKTHIFVQFSASFWGVAEGLAFITHRLGLLKITNHSAYTKQKEGLSGVFLTGLFWM